MSTKTDALQPVQEHGWRMGFANLFRKENSEWWRTRQWWVQALIWLAIVNGILAVVLWTVPTEPANATPENRQAQAAQSASQQPKDVEGLFAFFLIGGTAAGIGVIIIAQGLILDEKKSGTLAWVLSKPVSRTAFFLSKLIANGIAVLAIMVVLQGAAAFVQISAAKQALLPVIPFAGAVLLMGLYIVFFLTLTLMLGVLFDNRGAAIGIPLALNFGFQFLAGLGLAQFLPYWLIAPAGGSDASLAVMLANQQPLPTILPIVSTIVWIVLFVVVALWRFERIEF